MTDAQKALLGDHEAAKRLKEECSFSENTHHLGFCR